MSFVQRVALRVAETVRAIGVALQEVGRGGVALARWAERLLDALHLVLVGGYQVGRLFGAGAAFRDDLEGMENRAREWVRNIEGIVDGFIGMGDRVARLL